MAIFSSATIVGVDHLFVESEWRTSTWPFSDGLELRANDKFSQSRACQ